MARLLHAEWIRNYTSQVIDFRYLGANQALVALIVKVVRSVLLYSETVHSNRACTHFPCHTYFIRSSAYSSLGRRDRCHLF